MDHSAGGSMKNVAKYVNRVDVHNSADALVFERTLRARSHSLALICVRVVWVLENVYQGVIA